MRCQTGLFWPELQGISALMEGLYRGLLTLILDPSSRCPYLNWCSSWSTNKQELEYFTRLLARCLDLM